MEPFIGQIAIFGGNFAPRGWAFCDGQLLPINQNQALFSLLGTTYGGDGRSTFGLPDLRSRAPIHAGHGPGLSNRRLGSKSGEEYHTLTAQEMPNHNHTTDFKLKCTNDPGDSTLPEGRHLAETPGTGFTLYAPSQNANIGAGETTVNPNGGGQGHNNMQPYLAVQYIIALQGIFPSRS